MPNAGGGDPTRPWAREQREQPLRVGGVHTCVAGVCSCTGDFARGCGCTWAGLQGVCVHGAVCAWHTRVRAPACVPRALQPQCGAGRQGGAGSAVSHRVMPCHTALCHVMPCHTVPCHLMPCRASPAPLSLPCPPWEAPIGVVLPQSGCPHAGSPQHSVPPPLLGPSRGSPRGGGCCPPAPRLQPPPFYSDLHVF